ncbi:hypothetical protein NQ315_002500 [Exocentrus adspersus]|uniref:Uncharacterized protein n=1 Tax=Exocentrus adspersus TaxID=1586481 RepID=A0AAV8VM74_9CUCU|nr:hypothetical protein NQ315_002500 [Exocentrus adspersus]
MVNLAYPTAPAEIIQQLSVSCFIDGLRDSEIGQMVRLAWSVCKSHNSSLPAWRGLYRHKTISEVLAQALEIEATKQAS